MEHTKSELKVYKGFDRLYLYATQLPGCPRIADIPDTGAITEEEIIANAQHLVKCWNEYDKLKAKEQGHDDLRIALGELYNEFRNSSNLGGEQIKALDKAAATLIKTKE